MAVRNCVLLLIFAVAPAVSAADETAPARDPKQAVNEAYTAKIKKYTTAPVFTSPLVNYLPASKNVPNDTGWTFGELFNVKVFRITDTKVLDTGMERVNEVRPSGGVQGGGAIFAINNNAEPALATLRYKLRDADMQAAEEAFEYGGKKFNRGSLIVRGVARSDFDRAANEAGLRATALSVRMHPVRAARVAFVHTWLSTQTEGWWRLALDNLRIPYDYISNSKYDVILFPPVGYNASTNAIINGTATAWGNPLPWKNTPETPNLVGKNDSTDDMRPGLGWEGVAHLQSFVAKGGVLLTATDTSRFALSIGLGTASRWVPRRK